MLFDDNWSELYISILDLVEIDILNILEWQQKNQNGLKVLLFVNNATLQIEKNTSLVIEEKNVTLLF